VCEAGLPFALKKGQISQIWPFWNCLPEIKWFGHLAIFLAFLKVEKIVSFRLVLEKSEQN